MGHRPVTDLVVQAWLAALPGLSAGMVGAKLPQDTSGWAETGFVQATTVTGPIDPDTGLRHAHVQLDCWAVHPGSAKPPWFRANQVAESIVAACVDGAGQQATYQWAAYDPARVLTARPLGEPRRVPGDDGGFARYTFDIELTWVAA